MKFKWGIFLIIVCLNLCCGILATNNFMQLKWNHSLSYSFACWFYTLYFFIFSYIQTRFFCSKRNIFWSIVLLLIISYVLGVIIWSIGSYTFAPDSFIEKSKNYMDSPHFNLAHFIWTFLIGSFFSTFHAFWGGLSTLTYAISHFILIIFRKAFKRTD